VKSLITVFVILAFAGAGVGGGYYYLTQIRGTSATPETDPNPVGIEATQHGTSLDVPDDAVICPEHKVAEIICPFCKPALVEELGWCGGHDVAEALCTRCNPVLIAAFKAENDWCAEHGLPESQCLICNPASKP
jgi:hypothetical protein